MGVVAEKPAGRSATDVRVIAALGLTLVLWASAFVAVRDVGRVLAPGTLAFGRLLVGSLALAVVMVLRRERLPARGAFVPILVCGILWFGLYNLMLNAGTTSLLVNTGPIFIALLAGFVLREGFPRNLFLGSAVAFSGVAVIAVAVSSAGVQATWGAALCLGAALAYAGGVVAQKFALRQASALGVTWMACTVGALFCLPFARELGSELVHARPSIVAWTVYLGLGPTAIGFLGWAYALSRSDAGRLGASTYLVPPLVVLIGWLALSETPPPLALPGGALCLAGVALARRRRPILVVRRKRDGAGGGTAQPPPAELL